MTDAHRPLDDLTRDLRAASQQYVRESDQPFWGYRQSALSLEAADAIDRLRGVEQNARCAPVENESDPTPFPGHELLGIGSEGPLLCAACCLAGSALSMPCPALANSSSDSGELPRLGAKIGGDPLPEANDAVASLAPLTAEDGVRRWRRRIDLDGGKYSIFLAETFPPDLDLPGEPKRLPAAFLRDGEPWEIFRYSGFVNALAEALWERAYAPPTRPDVARPDPTEWTIATAFEQLEKCRYACERGPLENNVAYRWLKGKIAAATTLGALRPILLDHRLETFFVAGKNGARVCRCGLSFSDSSGWVEHVLEALALTPKDSVLRAFEDDGPPSETLASAWRAVPLTVGLLFDALGRAEHLPFSKGATLDALSCEVERAGRAVVEGKS